ncbi:hypothetical protein CH272_02620 [Rhodococcus sp. 05-340-1]|uniref:WXG100 family type VII secretion target n=1 Tax=unclassified Rhodococcus (in: high G+C Gram-positive bacteria) TaxID=192944 RepID=UPI000B9A91B2|nr:MULTISPECIES: WXG100 family type VII secretion target [unclassified Rhodococcus (in: high G+C Gram-positive bacteria)]OZD69940.1 hypothetical protein CH271_07915 [Rhodococcus sp. 05-340-2]OZD83316.1 hypothetical protein CH272_02620 [Rhodococcus sp. 05-340-1]
MPALGSDAFKIDLQQLDSAIASMQEFTDDTSEILEQVSNTVAALRVDWTGIGSDAYQDAQDRWVRGARDMTDNVTELREVAKTAHANYSNAIDANMSMWLM